MYKAIWFPHSCISSLAQSTVVSWSLLPTDRYLWCCGERRTEQEPQITPTMSTKLRILVPVKRVIDYAVGLPLAMSQKQEGYYGTLLSM